LPPAKQARGRGLLLLTLHLQAAERSGAAVRARERALCAERLGRDEPDPARARSALAERAGAAAPGEDADWLGTLHVLGSLRLALWPVLAGLAAKPLARLS
jgi:hypothetical protein